MLRVGLTGGIACGKSLVAEFFRRRAIPVVNDDEAAREAVAKGTLGLAAVVAEFGEDVLLADGTLNRPELARRVFADDAKRRRLMAVTHPAIGRLLRQRFAEAEQSGARIIVYESALLVENGVASAWRPLVVVRTTRELQIFRLARRSGLTPKEAEDRIRSQMSVDEKARHADFVIDNSGTEADVEERFVSVFAELMRLAQT